MNAVVYARYSSYGQTEQSIEGQLHVCEEYAKKKDFNIINTYVDRAMTGTNDNRPAFQAMIEDAKKGAFQVIIVYKLDRFSRDKYDNVVYKHKLAQCGVKVLSATEAISDSPEGIMMEGLLELFAEMYSKDLSQKVKRGMRESVSKGYFLGGYTPYGYKVENKKLVIDDEQAKNIKYMFEMYANGLSKKEIVKHLNERGFRTNRGKQFTINSFQKTLSNTKYIGEITINGETYVNYCPPIIDKKLFERVQERLKENKHYSAKRKAEEVFLLTGKIYCGYCESSIVGISGTSHTKKRHSYYVCSNRFKHKSCNKQYEKKGYLEWYLVSQIKEKLADEATRKELARLLIDEYKKSDYNKQITDYKIKINGLEKELDNICDKLININNTEIIKKLEARANDIADLKQTYQTQLNKLILSAKIAKTENDIENSLALLARGDALEFEYQKRIIDIFVDKVFLFDDKFIAYFNLLNMKQVSFVEMLQDVEELANGDGFAYCSHRPARQKQYEPDGSYCFFAKN